MKVLVLSNNKFEEKEINNKLEELQKIVGGYIEIPFISETLYNNGIDIIINEEGKFIEGCKPEIAIVTEAGQVADVIHGNCIFASHNEEGDTIGLTEKQIKIVMRELKMDGTLMYSNGEEYITKMLFI
jgi:hypothetical protein